MTKRLQVGVYGGSFDPPHNAHVALASAAVGQLGLDLLHIVPTGHAWHKTRTLSLPEHRLAMAQLAFGGLPQVRVDPQETRRPGASYTIDTLEALQGQYPGAHLVLVMGEDQASALERWRRWQDILRIATLCIATRAVELPGTARFDPESLPAASVRRLELPDMPESATAVRALAAQGRSIAHLVPEAIARYIAHHHLYPNTA